ncbi:MAG: hypothetical protein SFY80_07430 [Verrucomicrobiota bacterium]|nr:hypothetical protein [Verrucomicrobiota bacterium]
MQQYHGLIALSAAKFRVTRAHSYGNPEFRMKRAYTVETNEMHSG